MIKNIGIDKVLLLIILAVVAVAGYLYNTSFLEPDIIKTERQVRGVSANLGQITQDTAKLIEGVNLFDERKEEFVVIQKSGFFDDQNRIMTQKRLEEMQLESNLKSFRFSINPAEETTSNKLKDSGYKVLSTKLELRLGAIDDTDVGMFLYLLNHGFPGQMIISSISMEKKQNLTQPLLRNIGLDDAPYDPLVEAIVEADWYTMVPDDNESNDVNGAR